MRYRGIIFTTGGTFDKEYGIGAGVRDLSFGKYSVAPNILKKAGVKHWEIQRLVAKDSLDITGRDRKKIVNACARTKHDSIVILHGTDTMVATAAEIAVQEIKKAIVLSGSLQPARMKESDADFNLGFALASAVIAPRGVYIAMHGRLFYWNRVRKHPTTGRFVAID